MKTVIQARGYNHIQLFYDEDEDEILRTITPIIGFEYRSKTDKDYDELVDSCLLHPISMFNVEDTKPQCNITYGIQDPNGFIIVPECSQFANIEEFEADQLKICRRMQVKKKQSKKD